MAQDVDHVPVGITDEEATDPPKLVGQWVNDFRPRTDCRGMAAVDIIARHLLNESGFPLSAVVETGGAVRIVEAVAV